MATSADMTQQITLHEGPVGMIDRKMVAIVRFARPLGYRDIAPGVFYQVLLDPDKINGVFIRLGDNDGDELMGWQRCDFLRLCHIIALENEEGTLITLSDEESRKVIDKTLERLFANAQETTNDSV